MVGLRTGAPMRPQLLVEEAEEAPLPPAHEGLVAAMRRRWVIGEPKVAADRVRELAAEYGVDEVMVHPVAGATRGTDPGAVPAREATLRLLAEAL
jgi:alkanesulfonate monooxygenase SsuD/methylene tetrahydromethanopterin reductase-like flavin-dependent oxidoreductase (luciferase family)